MAGTNGTKPLNLDDLTDDAGSVIIKGTEYKVKQLDGPGWQLYDRIRGIVVKAREGEAPPDAISTDEFYSLAERCLPDAPKDVVWGLTAAKAGLVIGRAAGTLEQVEHTLPKAETEETRDSSSGSLQSTGSEVSSSRSRARRASR